jgi:hydrophobe/amphiphile efflux-3 (HAE3) family protein
MKERLEGLARIAARRPALTLAAVLAAALAGGVLALGLKPSAGTDTFVSRSSASFKVTQDDHNHFGGDAVIVLVRESLPDLVQTKDLATITQLEACLAGQTVVASSTLQSFVPAKAGSQPPYGGWGSPCGKLMRYKPVEVVYGPGTFLNRAVAAVNEQIRALLAGVQKDIASQEQAAYARALSKHLTRRQALTAAKDVGAIAQSRATQQLEQLYLNSGISGMPKIDDPQFIPEIVFDQTRGVNQPKARFAYLFPTANSALIQIRLKASLGDARQAQAISWIRQAVKMPMFRSAYGGTYTVTGAPVVANDLASQISGAILVLLIAAVVVMALTLLVVFRSPPRLLPLMIALAAAGITFGLLWLVGGTLTMASIAVLPILIGLAVDYAIQFQSRAEEIRRADGADPHRAAEGRPADTAAAVARAAALGAPTIGIAALATVTGFLVLLLSPVPMVRGFGLLLVVGIAVAFVCALTAGSAAMVLFDRDGGLLGALFRGAQDILRASARGAREIVRELGAKASAPLRVARRIPVPSLPRPRAPRAVGLLRFPAARPGLVLAVGGVLAVLGWVADTQTSVQSDVTKLVPTSMPALRDLHTLEQVTGVSGEIDVTVRAHDVATPTTVGWMIRYEQTLLRHYGYLETKGCAHSTLCPALSLPDLFSTTWSTQNALLTTATINALLSAVPSYFSQAVLTPDHREATLAFGIRLMPLSKQQRVIDYMSSQLHPPAGVSAYLAGLPVLAAQANASLSSSGHRLLTLLAGLAAVGLVLLAVFRQVERALVPLVPIALATGWSALILFAISIPLNPMSATLGALVIAISTEFSVLLSERFRQERAAGHELDEALARTYRSTGRAVLASGITAIAGFGVLVLSDITMLRDFGFVTLVDLTVSLGGVLLVLPAVLALSERKGLLAGVRGLPRRAAMSLPRPRRRARVA